MTNMTALKLPLMNASQIAHASSFTRLRIINKFLITILSHGKYQMCTAAKH